MKNQVNSLSAPGVLFAVFFAIILIASCSKDEESNPVLDNLPGIKGYPVVGTDQKTHYNDLSEISAPAEGTSYFGQNADYPGNKPTYVNNGNGTVTDMVTGLMWQKSPDTDRDGDIDAADKLTYNQAVSFASTYSLGGFSDWRLPTIKELYSLIMFSGMDLNPNSTTGLKPFINTEYFDFAYGDVSAGERIIDAQFASSTKYVGNDPEGDMVFGVNFADGRIKGYGLKMPVGPPVDKTFFVLYVRGNQTYGQNSFTDNGDGTITDAATGLMWMKDDTKLGLLWVEALAYAEGHEFAGYSDWRLPDAKELQSIIDYSRSPGSSNSAAIDPVFNCTQITNESGEPDYPFYWSGTTHANMSPEPGGAGVYLCFGRALGYMNGSWVDVHGAGAQRSDPKTGDPGDYPEGHGPQGDAVRIYNFVRLVRNVK